jgi:hypothetical protein
MFDFSKDQLLSLPGTNHRFDVPAFPDPTGSSAAAQDVARVMWEHAAEFTGSAASIKADRRYSDIGRADQLEPIAGKAFNTLLGSWHILNGFEREINATEAQLLAIPKIDMSHTVAHLEDRELRDWWNRLDVKKQAEHMIAFQNGDSTSERVALAILRSPIPVNDTVKASFKSTWEAARRADNPVQAERIALGRQAIEWTEKNLHFAATVVKSTSGWQPQQIIRHGMGILDGVFDFSKSDIAQFKLRREAESRPKW